MYLNDDGDPYILVNVVPGAQHGQRHKQWVRLYIGGPPTTRDEAITQRTVVTMLPEDALELGAEIGRRAREAMVGTMAEPLPMETPDSVGTHDIDHWRAEAKRLGVGHVIETFRDATDPMADKGWGVRCLCGWNVRGKLRGLASEAAARWVGERHQRRCAGIEDDPVSPYTSGHDDRHGVPAPNVKAHIYKPTVDGEGLITPACQCNWRAKQPNTPLDHMGAYAQWQIHHHDASGEIPPTFEEWTALQQALSPLAEHVFGAHSGSVQTANAGGVATGLHAVCRCGWREPTLYAENEAGHRAMWNVWAEHARLQGIDVPPYDEQFPAVQFPAVKADTLAEAVLGDEAQARVRQVAAFPADRWRTDPDPAPVGECLVDSTETDDVLESTITVPIGDVELSTTVRAPIGTNTAAVGEAAHRLGKVLRDAAHRTVARLHGHSDDADPDPVEAEIADGIELKASAVKLYEDGTTDRIDMVDPSKGPHAAMIALHIDIAPGDEAEPERAYREIMSHGTAAALVEDLLDAIVAAQWHDRRDDEGIPAMPRGGFDSVLLDPRNNPDDAQWPITLADVLLWRAAQLVEQQDRPHTIPGVQPMVSRLLEARGWARQVARHEAVR